MKKKLAVMLTMILTMSLLGGCGKDKQNDTNESTAADTAASTQESSSQQEEVQIKPLKDWDMHAYVTFGEYKGLKIEISPMEEVGEEDINALALAAYNGSMGGTTSRAVAAGDTVNIDYEGKLDGVAFEGGTAAGASLTIGSGQFIEGFEEGLIDVMPGETVALNLTFPEGYTNAELAGKEVVFTVTVNAINITDVSEMTDEGVASAGEADYTNVQELKDYCKEYLQYMTDNEYKVTRDSAVIEQLMAIATFTEVPAELTKKYESNIIQTLEARAMQAGATADDYATYYYGTDAKTYAATYAEESAKQSIAFFAIADLENLLVSDEELDKSLAEYAEEMGAPSVEEMMGSLDKEEFREYFTFEKVIDFLYENAAVTEKTAA